MPYAAGYSTAADLSVALQSVCDDVIRGLNGNVPDLSFLFVSHSHREHFADLARFVSEKTQTRHLLGCTGETIAGGSHEIESGPVISLLAASLPGAQLQAFHAEFSQTPDGIICAGLPTETPPDAPEPRAVFLLGEPFSSAPQSILDRLKDDLPDVPVVGGMASGAHAPGMNRLFLDHQTIDHGAVGVVVRGGPRIRTVVSQGCRPIGTHFVVTKGQQNVVQQLSGLPAMQRLGEVLQDLPDRDRRLVQNGLHLGIVINEYQESFDRGDFLIANVLGADPNDESMTIGNTIRVGQTVQFHVRDAVTADEDLTQLLQEELARNSARPQAALLFSCNGRGSHMFPAPNHDASCIQSLAGPLPLAGFFAQGELGPVGGQNYIHGYTASIVCFD